MDYVNTTITGSNADVFFGNDSTPLGSRTLGATLRFIALKHHQGEIETIKPIKIATDQFYDRNNGNSYAQTAKANGIELYILSAPRGAQLPTINEDGWVSMDTPPYPVTAFLSPISETRIYSNDEIKSTVIFVRNPTERWVDALCSTMFRILPWHFKGDIQGNQ